MLEIRKGTAAKSYENTFFREFADKLNRLFEKYSLPGLLIANSECESENRLQIDALLVTTNAVCIIDFKNFGGKIHLPSHKNSGFETGEWTNENGERIKGGSSINPFVQLKNQKRKFNNVVKRRILNRLPKTDRFNQFHTLRLVCFQKPIELVGSIPSSEELNFSIIDATNYLEKIRDIIDIHDKDVSLSEQSFTLFKEAFRADKFDISENYEETGDVIDSAALLDINSLYPDQKSALTKISQFLKSSDDKVFVLHGTSLSGKSHLIPYIQDLAFGHQISGVEFLAASGRVAKNLENLNGLQFSSLYSFIYSGKPDEDDEEDEEDEEEKGVEVSKQESQILEIIPLRKSDERDDVVYIVDESHLISDSYYESLDLIFGTGKLLQDFITFVDFENTKRKIIFIGDTFQLSLGKASESAIVPEYLNQKYEIETKSFQLVDKEKQSPIVEQALKAAFGIRNQSFNNLSFDIGEVLARLKKNELLSAIEKSIASKVNSHILCYTNLSAMRINGWIKNKIIGNGNDLAKEDLVILRNNIRVEDESDPFAEPKKLFNGQFAKVVSVTKAKKISDKLLVPLFFREVIISLDDTKETLHVLSLENYRLSVKGELTESEKISFLILLSRLAERELKNFQDGLLPADNTLKELLAKLAEGKRVKKKVIVSMERCLNRIPSSDYYKYRNSARLRFGWAMTVHHAVSFKWDEVFFDVERQGKTNEDYFRWVYSGLIRGLEKMYLINYEPITPFSKLDVKLSVNKQANRKEHFYIADTTIDAIQGSEGICQKYNFPQSETTPILLQLFQFLSPKIESLDLKVDTIIHTNNQERYQIRGSEGQKAVISIYYNKKGQFNSPTILTSQPEEFGVSIVSKLEAKGKRVDFQLIKDEWRKESYERLDDALGKKGIEIRYIDQSAYKDTITFYNQDNSLVIDMHYDGDGFFSTAIASSSTDASIWSEVKNILSELKK